MPEKEIIIRRLEKTDERSDFHSDDIELDRFFQRYAGQNQFRHYIGSTYVAVLGKRVIGFVTVSSSELTAEGISVALKKRLPNYPIPVLRIARLAVVKEFKGLGVGKKLLISMLRLALEIKEQIGCVGVVVDAKPEATGFYEKLGFAKLDSLRGDIQDRPQPLPMFLPLVIIEKAMPKR